MRTLHFAVCDDEQTQTDYMTTLITRWAAEKALRAVVTTYGSAEQFLFDYAENKSHDILLLDIQMKALSGIELAKHIRAVDDALQIVFVTGFSEFMAEGYDVSALHYLMKPVHEEKLYAVLDKAAAALDRQSRTVLIEKKNGAVRVKIDDVVYAEVISHTTTLHLVNGTVEVPLRISDVTELLGDGFFKCHRSYVVSLRYVRRVTRTAMLLEDGKEIPLSRELYAAANKAFISFN